MPNTATLLAGVPSTNQALFHRIRFAVGDSAAIIELHKPDAYGKPTGNSNRSESILLVRDIEMDRARKLNRADHVGCAADYAPSEGLSGDRDTALAQGTAECLVQHGVETVTADRTLPFIFAWHIQQRGINIEYSADLGVMERRIKDDEEIAHLQKAQAMTEQAMQFACETIARAEPNGEGILQHEGEPLTSQRVRSMISIFLLERGFSNHYDSIVATLPQVADCHHHGDGPVRTELPVIVDIFPRDNETRYWGDCTRTVVNGQPTDKLIHMHRAVVNAKAEATAALIPGNTGEQVHLATTKAMTDAGYPMGPVPADAPDTFVSMRHGTGHGIGLDVHEPILLDLGAGEMLAGEVFTVEPGLYSRAFGGVRVEDMIVVTPNGPRNLNNLHEGLDWT